MNIFDRFKSKPTDTSMAYAPMTDTKYTLQLDITPPEPVANIVQPTLAVDDLNAFAYAGQTGYAGAEYSNYDGEKFFGGFGTTQIQNLDYWALRQRSAQLFNENLYAKGLIRRLVTNEINTGLTPEASPDEQIIGVAEESLDVWTETVENRFAIWGKNPELCDWRRADTFGSLQRTARMESLISGDVLVVARISKQTGLPTIQLISGDKVQTPLGGQPKLRKGHTIVNGVEMDAAGRVVAHWVRQKDLKFKRLPAFGSKTGRRISWLVYGTERRLDEVRGQPILALVMQSLKEIDRYRDSTQRKAVINSIMAMFIKKGEDKMGTLPVAGGAVRRDQATVTDSDGTNRTFNMASMIPGAIMEELQTGEEPVLLGGQGTDTNFGVFEESIVQAVAWANEIPPEILRLAFSNNYSASQAAINEFKIYLNKIWAMWGETFCMPIYIEWLLSETLMQKITAPSLLSSWRDPEQYDIFGAWVCTEWYGSIKPSTDQLKQVKASELLVAGGYSTRAREARITTGTKFSKNAKRLKRENEQLVEAMRPVAEFKQEFNISEEEVIVAANLVDSVVSAVEDSLAG